MITNLIMILLPALAVVESGCNDAAIGDSGRSLGRYQIQAACVADANAYAGTSYAWRDMTNPASAEAVAVAYLLRWGAHYERVTGEPANAETLARIWNGGPNGWQRGSTEAYWAKVEDAMVAAKEGRDND